jgi:peptidoglycan-associated lipoprotein
MRSLLLVLLATAVAACSTARPAATPEKGISERSGTDISGRWTGKWAGAGLLMAPREDAVTVELEQYGDVAYGRLVFEGANAAESVPIDLRYAGLWGIRVRAKISRDKVTLRHEAGGHLFTADLKLAGDQEHMYGLVRGPHPNVALVLTRAPRAVPTPPQAAMATPAPAAPPAEPSPRVTPSPNVVVIAPEPTQPEPLAPPREENFEVVAELSPIHFDFDKADLRKDAMDTLTAHVEWLKDHADTLVLIEGHCDERGTDEYNLALGERRAKSVSELLSEQGIAPERISTTSQGRERPVCTVGTEECRMKNRRAEFRVKTR